MNKIKYFKNLIVTLFISPYKYIAIIFFRQFKNFYSGYGYFLKTGRPLPFGSICNKPSNIMIGENFSMGRYCKLYAQDNISTISIGDRVSLNDNVMLNADNGGKIIIGNGCMFGPNTVLRASNHKFSLTDKFFCDQGHEAGIIFIGNNVWFGSNVVVLPNVSIGNNVVIGAGSVVTKDIPSCSLAYGIPAKVHKKI